MTLRLDNAYKQDSIAILAHILGSGGAVGASLTGGHIIHEANTNIEYIGTPELKSPPVLCVTSLTGNARAVNDPIAGVYQQNTWRWRNDDGDQATATWRELAQTDTIVTDATPLRLRIALNNLTTAVPSYAKAAVVYRINGGEWRSLAESIEDEDVVIARKNIRYQEGNYSELVLTPAEEMFAFYNSGNYYIVRPESVVTGVASLTAFHQRLLATTWAGTSWSATWNEANETGDLVYDVAGVVNPSTGRIFSAVRAFKTGGSTWSIQVDYTDALPATWTGYVIVWSSKDGAKSNNTRDTIQAAANASGKMILAFTVTGFNINAITSVDNGASWQDQGAGFAAPETSTASRAHQCGFVGNTANIWVSQHEAGTNKYRVAIHNGTTWSETGWLQGGSIGSGVGLTTEDVQFAHDGTDLLALVRTDEANQYRYRIYRWTGTIWESVHLFDEIPADRSTSAFFVFSDNTVGISFATALEHNRTGFLDSPEANTYAQYAWTKKPGSSAVTAHGDVGKRPWTYRLNTSPLDAWSRKCFHNTVTGEVFQIAQRNQGGTFVQASTWESTTQQIGGGTFKAFNSGLQGNGAKIYLPSLAQNDNTEVEIQMEPLFDRLHDQDEVEFRIDRLTGIQARPKFTVSKWELDVKATATLSAQAEVTSSLGTTALTGTATVVNDLIKSFRTDLTATATCSSTLTTVTGFVQVETDLSAAAAVIANAQAFTRIYTDLTATATVAAQLEIFTRIQAALTGTATLTATIDDSSQTAVTAQATVSANLVFKTFEAVSGLQGQATLQAILNYPEQALASLSGAASIGADFKTLLAAQTPVACQATIGAALRQFNSVTADIAGQATLSADAKLSGELVLRGEAALQAVARKQVGLVTNLVATASGLTGYQPVEDAGKYAIISVNYDVDITASYELEGIRVCGEVPSIDVCGEKPTYLIREYSNVVHRKT